MGQGPRFQAWRDRPAPEIPIRVRRRLPDRGGYPEAGSRAVHDVGHRPSTRLHPRSPGPRSSPVVPPATTAAPRRPSTGRPARRCPKARRQAVLPSPAPAGAQAAPLAGTPRGRASRRELPRHRDCRMRNIVASSPMPSRGLHPDSGRRIGSCHDRTAAPGQATAPSGGRILDLDG
jgi:hypothetical protein